MNTSFRSGLSSMSLSSLPTGSRRATSVYSGAGGRSVRVSRVSGAGFDLSTALGAGVGVSGNFAVTDSKKVTMQNLNDRLATYLEKVRSLESANVKLELQIRQWYEKQTPTLRDYSQYEAIILDLRKQISVATQDNTSLLLHIDNARLASDDFRIKFESELAVRMSVENDILGLRKLMDDLTIGRSDLEMQVEGLKDELVYLKKNHAEEIAALRAVVSSNSVNVEVDARDQGNLTEIIDNIRAQYEGITDKNRSEMESWYKAKFDDLNKQVTTSTLTIQTSQSEITELKMTLQALQIDLQSQFSMKSALEGQLADTESRYSLQLSQLQSMVNSLESELSQMRADIERQSMDYQMLLDIKTRLELEIAEYRRLLDGDDIRKTVVQTVEVVKPQPVITQRRKVVIEELVDGKVVSRTEDVDTSIIS